MAYETDINPATPRSRGDYDASHMSPVMPEEDLRTIMINRVAWGPVFAGVAMALVTQLILNLAGVGIGAATLVPDTTSNWAVANISIGSAIWWTVSGVIAAYAGGYTAGRLSGEPKESSAGWHGLTSWAVSVLVLAFILTAGTGAVMGGMLNTAGFSTSGAKAAQSATPPAATSTEAPSLKRNRRRRSGACRN